MAKIDLDQNELAAIANALDQAIKSAKRAQVAGKTPQIKEVYHQHETVLNALMLKLFTAKA